MKEILFQFGLHKENVKIQHFGNGLINSTWLVEKISDAKFTDGRLKVRFSDNKMYTSGNAIGIKYEKKIYSIATTCSRMDGYVRINKIDHEVK